MYSPVDSFGKECLQLDKLLYNYKNSVGVPPLGMVDDVLCVSDCGVDTVLLNAFMRAKSNIKKVQYGVEKCHKIHVGKKSSCCPVLKIDEWEVKDITEIDTGKVKYEDSFKGEGLMKESEDEKYLGDIISYTKNIKAMVDKGVGNVKQIISILREFCFGKFQFEVAIILRNSLLLSSMLTNAETWVDVKKSEIVELEQVDKIFSEVFWKPLPQLQRKCST